MNLNIRPAPVRAFLGALLLGVALSSGGAPAVRAETPLAEAVPCLPCHSRAGMRERPQVPSILGQDARYLIHQITAFQRQFAPRASGFLRLERKHPVMSTQAPKVAHADIGLVADHFASQACVNAWELDGGRTRPLPQPLLANRCFLCHGQAGRSRHAFVPSLAGQRRDYLRKQILSFRDTRRTDLSQKGAARVHNMMTRQGAQLTDEQVATLADYFASQPCR